MKRKSLLTLVAALMFFSLLTACGGGSAADPLKGEWEGTNDDGIACTWVFDGKGSCSMDNEFGFEGSGAYTVDENSVIIALIQWDYVLSYTFEIDGSSLLLTAGEDYRPSYELKKQ